MKTSIRCAALAATLTGITGAFAAPCNEESWHAYPVTIAPTSVDYGSAGCKFTYIPTYMTGYCTSTVSAPGSNCKSKLAYLAYQQWWRSTCSGSSSVPGNDATNIMPRELSYEVNDSAACGGA